VPMVQVPGGRVTIGRDHGPLEEAPAHVVEIASFGIDVTEVTVSAYAVCVKRGACTAPVKGEFCTWEGKDTADHPINCVDWGQAKAYCAWAGKRLPTEKEWEYAARGTDARRFPWGSTPGPGPRLCNVCGSECRLHGAMRNRAWNAMHDYDDGWPITAPVGRFPAGDSAFGAKDMAGNVWEWTSSPYCPYPEEQCGNEIEYVMRGGGWMNSHALNMEATTREGRARTDALEALGFRCAR
jgi:formylglycine-generating enzyme required for sulfatase activity